MSLVAVTVSPPIISSTESTFTNFEYRVIIIINVLQHIGTESQWKVLPKAKLH